MSSINMISIVMFFLGLFTLVSANTIKFQNLDSQPREICWYPPQGYPAIHSSVIKPFDSITVGLSGRQDDTFISGIGYQFHPINAGGGEAACVQPTIVGEITFQGYQGNTYYDISAVDNCCQNNGIHYFYPHNDASAPHSGCFNFPCGGVYIKPGDPQTKITTWDTDMIVLLWNN
ncbi:uncharacterized protein PAC_06130 [Phialocephala subalpina]|uniref:Uncharacterized protein n=1 Tax=Phialocephala subalpina TaxID=576137 RepID=A0A1L7WU00_9HELO|nr:uncharacterized protein PAC_06130 [Phialocephala subalpina]